ncbi:hypothetical protein [Stenotrophomonas maltophilia]|uniref:hypothetical protein n=1 Tax=Stenotrophomonas maltophilia TaxID=40324 RepID=UPI0013DC359D|nr:hypothetical protein [Stenotrophomonas maltophilia]
MIAAEVMVPCFSWAPACRLDWAALSAVATFIAVLVALLVGILPVALNYHSRRGQAKLLGMVAVDDLLVQELHLRAAVRVPSTANRIVTSWEYEQVNKCVHMLNPRSAVELIAFGEFVPAKVRTAIAQAVSSVAAAEQRRTFLLVPQAGVMYNLAGDIAWYEEVCESLVGLRKELCKWLNVKMEDESAGGIRLAEILRLTAGQDRQAWLDAQRKGNPVA